MGPVSNTPHTPASWRVILLAILLAKAAVATFSIAPFLIGSYIDSLNMDASLAGKILSVEIFALSISNVFAYFWINRVNVIAVAKILLIGLFSLNLLCAFSTTFEFVIVLRGVIGIFEGSLLAAGFGLLSTTDRPNRNFGLYFATSLTIGAINVQIIPLFIEALGARGLFLNLAFYSVMPFLALFLFGVNATRLTDKSALEEPQHDNTSAAQTDKRKIQLLIGLVLIANFIYFLGQGGVWSFFERLGQQQGMSISAISFALSSSLLAGVAGGLSATWLDNKYGQLPPLGFAIFCGLASVYILNGHSTTSSYLIAACLFNYGNNLGHAYLLGIVANYSRGPQLTVLSGALQTLGQATGPLVAGMLVIGTDYSNVIVLGAITFSITTLVIFPAMWVWQRNIKADQLSTA